MAGADVTRNVGLPTRTARRPDGARADTARGILGRFPRDRRVDDAPAPMTMTLGVVMDPIESVTPYKDTTFAMLLAAQARGWTLHVIEQPDIFLHAGRVHARRRRVRVFDDDEHWFEAEDAAEAPLAEHDVILMRKDPPFDMDYVYTTYLLEHAAAEGVLVSNRPSSLRDVNEKLSTAWFPELCPPTLVTADPARLKRFVHEHGDAIVKPLDGMGGAGIFRLRPDDPNLNIVLELSTRGGELQIMAQRYVPAIAEGDKRVLVVAGEAVDHALARIPSQGETRGNLAAGGRGVPVAIGGERTAHRRRRRPDAARARAPVRRARRHRRLPDGDQRDEPDLRPRTRRPRGRTGRHARARRRPGDRRALPGRARARARLTSRRAGGETGGWPRRGRPSLRIVTRSTFPGTPLPGLGPA